MYLQRPERKFYPEFILLTWPVIDLGMILVPAAINSTQLIDFYVVHFLFIGNYMF